MNARLRVVAVHLQPQIMRDDGETLTPVDSPQLEISAADWPQYSAETWPGVLAHYQAELDEREAAKELAARGPNRAARRARKPATPRSR